MSRSGCVSRWFILPLLLLPAFAPRVRGAQILLKDGRILEGKLGMTASLAELESGSAPGETGPLRLIVFLDDDLRRTFVSKRQVQNVRQDDPGEIYEKFRLRQRVLRGGKTVKSVGPIVRVTPFDEYGRRIFTMNTHRGPEDIIQGITEITPKWTKVEGITHVWDMRMATSSLPPDVLDKILRHQIDAKDPDQRKKIAQFYLQSERYEQAADELEAIIKAFPNDPNLAGQLAPTIQRIKQLGARRLLSELKLRREAGQHRFVLAALNSFPPEGVAGEILQAVRAMIGEYQGFEAQGKEILEKVDSLLARVEDPKDRKRLEPVCEEIRNELNIHTLDRMASFRLASGDESLLPNERLARAVSGWLVGSDSATDNLPVALSLFEVRRLVREYLNAPDKLTRTRILETLRSQEGATPRYVAKIVLHMKPPLEPPEPVPHKPGYYELEVPGLQPGPNVPYLVQLPPEYDPLRRYPAVLTLNGSGTTPSHQVDWWAGAWTADGRRLGQATRHGYIVIAPQWASRHQKQYGYTARELAAVLHSLRDACRRFSIDTDRVFLSGHSMGGDAAWDLGLAHPDLWAGVIPIVARSDKYCVLYWENAELVPWYFVAGEMDGGKMTTNATDWDRYLKRGYNATVAEFLGRGHEEFSDEVLRLFDWMDRFKRDFYPREFEVSTLRYWDSFFWYVELGDLPPAAMIDPVDWPPGRGVNPVETKASLTANNGIYVRTGAGSATVWLSPEMVSFDQRTSITVNGRRVNTGEPFLEGDVETILEDVRTRGDRQHPFWVRLDTATGRGAR